MIRHIMYTSMSVPKKTGYLSPLQCLPDPVFSERAEGEFRGMKAKESTALCDRVVIFIAESFVTNKMMMFAKN